VMQCTVAVGTCVESQLQQLLSGSSSGGQHWDAGKASMREDMRRTCIPVHGAKLVAKLPPKPYPPRIIRLGTLSPARHRDSVRPLPCTQLFWLHSAPCAPMLSQAQH